ncbi:beta family protein [Streptomyces malaysiensis]|uniref:beta family protein n=1 Tax=Streptomyces malaysiensis TaxID=92644 RepID=UPI0011CEA852|nr:beta family protein [Streptomyces malaysiensis]
MVEPIYVPVLPTRRSAWDAYAGLDTEVRRRVAPLWTVVPRVGPERIRGAPLATDPDTDSPELGRWFTKRMDDLIEAMDGLTGWVDPVHIERHVEASAIGLWHVATRSELRLVTGPERAPTLQRYAADLAFLSGRGIGIRVLLDVGRGEPSPTDLLTLIAQLRLPPSQLDLILDIGMVADATKATKQALVALDALGALVSWRTVVLTAGAFPRDWDRWEQPTRIAERHDWQIHQTVRAARPEFPGPLIYGDYSVEHAQSANIVARRYGPAYGLLRYTAPHDFLIARAPLRGPDHADRVRAMARRIVMSDAFRGIEDTTSSDGETWLHACADGDGSTGSGNAETWIRVGHLQHMNYVPRQLIQPK